MRQLKDLTVKGMALVKSPANKKHFLLHKSEESSVAEPEQPQLEQAFKAAPDSVRDAVRAVALAKGEDADATDALECVAHLVHAQKGLTLDDLIAAGRAAGLTDVAKAKAKASDDEQEDDEGEDEDEIEDEDGEGDEGGKSDKKMPAFLKEKLKKSQSPAEPSANQGEPMSAKEVSISKSEYDAVLEQVTKAHERIEKFERDEALRVEKSANAEAYGELNFDQDALARTTLSLRKSAPEDLKSLEATLKAANEQVRLSKSSGNSIFRPSSRAGAPAAVAKASGDRFKEMVDAHIAKHAGVTRQQAIAAVAKSAESVTAYNEALGEN